MNSEQIIQEATEAVEKGLPCAYLVPHLLEVAKNQKLEIEILIRKKEALRDEIAEQQAEIERLQRHNKEYGFCNLLGNCLVYSKNLKDYNDMRKGLKSEAYREFALDLKCGVPQETGVIRCADVDNTLKELTRNLHGKQ